MELKNYDLKKEEKRRKNDFNNLVFQNDNILLLQDNLMPKIAQYLLNILEEELF